FLCFFFSSRRRHTRFSRDWSSDVCSSDLLQHVIDHRQNDVRMPASGIDCALVPLTVDAKRDRATFGGGVDRKNLHIHLGCALVMLRIEEYSRKLAKVDKEIESWKKMKSDLLS